MSGSEHGSIVAARMIIDDDRESCLTDEDALAFLEPFLALTLLTPHAEAPPDVESRIAGLAAGGPETVGTTGADTGHTDGDRPVRSAGFRKTVGPAVRRAFHATVPAPIIALILMGAVLILSIALNVVAGRDSALAPISASYAEGTPAAEGARAVALWDGKHIVLFASGLAPLTEGYYYIAWSVRPAETVRLGRLVRVSGTNARLAVDGDRLPDRLEVTIENGVRPEQPAGPVVLVHSE